MYQLLSSQSKSSKKPLKIIKIKGCVECQFWKICDPSVNLSAAGRLFMMTAVNAKPFLDDCPLEDYIDRTKNKKDGKAI